MPLSSKQHTRPLTFFLAVNKPDLWWLVASSGLYGCGQISIIAGTYVLGRVIDALTFDPGRIAFWSILLILCVVLHEVLYRLGHICEIQIISRIRSNTKKALFDHTTSLSFGYFADRFAGEIAHKVATTADAFERMTLVVSNDFIENGVLILLSALFLGLVNWHYGTFIGVWATLFIIGSWILSGEMNRRASAYAAEEARTTGSIVDVYGNIGTVKVYGKDENIKTTHQQIDVEKNAFVRLGWWDVLTFNFQGTSIIVLCAGLVLITSMLHGRSALTTGDIAFISAAALRLFDVSWEMGKSVADFTRFRGECKQNLTDIVVAPAVSDGDRPETLANEDIRVEYHQVTFSYIPRQLVLDKFSIIVKPKQKVGIVGLSGAGKTTLANLLLRFFDPQHGSILLNDIDIRNFTQEFLRSHISYVSQDTSLFHATISENIAYGSTIVSEEDIERAAQLAYAADFIETLPNGYGSIVGERGVKLSGGQRQRIAIARALLADRPVFLLDEATSALDSDSEKRIQRGLAAVMENKTVIAIAHRLSTLSQMDRIVYLENGKIVEDGTHDELLAKEGKYAKLWHLQAGGFLPNITVE